MAACSRWGTVAFASSLDQAGPIARTVRDSAIMLRSMAGPDPKDTTCVDLPVPDFEAAVSRGVKGLKIGIPKEYRVDGMSPEIEQLWQQGAEWLRAAGAEIVEVSLPHTKYALPAYYIVAPAEASSNLARYDGVRYGLRENGKDIVDLYEKTRAAGFGREVKRRIMIGTYVLSAGYYDAYYVRAQKLRTLIKRDFEEVYAQGVRRHPDPGDAVRRLRHRREGLGRSGRDVSQRHLHRDREHGGPAGHRRAGRARRAGAAARPPAHRPRLRRGDALRRRPGDRGCGRPHQAAPGLVGLKHVHPTVPVIHLWDWLPAAFDPVLIIVAVWLGWKADQFGKVLIVGMAALAVRCSSPGRSAAWACPGSRPCARTR